MKIDARSKKIFIEFLKSKGFTNIKDTDDTEGQYYRLDVTAEFMGKTIAFELKDRTVKHNAFGDCFCEKSKYDAAVEFMNKKIYSAVYCCNFFSDEIFAISNILDGKALVKNCPNSTYFKNRSYKEKIMWSMPQQTLWDKKFRRIC